MSSSRLSRLLLIAGVSLSSLALPSVSRADDVLSQKVGKPLQDAQTALAAHNYQKAMAAVNAAAALPGKTDYETYTIAQMRAAVAAQSGDVAAASSAYDVLIASPRTPKAAKAQMMQAEATMAYNAKDYAKAVPAIERYLKQVGPDQTMQTLLVQSYYLQQDYKNAARVQNDIVTAMIKAKKTPAENQLQMLADCYGKLKDSSGQADAYTMLATYYPKPEYWALLLHGLETNDKLPPSLQLDVDRIRLAAGNLKETSDFIDMVEMAVQAGLPQLGLNLMNKGYKQGALGKDAGAAREARLKALVVKRTDEKKASLDADAAEAAKAPSGNALIIAGYNYVLYGQTDKGIGLIKEGITKGQTDPNIARLHLGLAQMDGGRMQDAITTLNTVGGDNGAKQIARLWVLKLHAAK
ncbi:hypothetical protein LOC54_04070 [Acetobacter sp. AN02]|uniref:hypothetical protein n=1 Tax=Acetobacter sp. AN02 TaxID=2894186 RepID=UPI00243429AB|nr:hypothetical protein [Acetobacter sp. AN02]MDG6094293.1 hypothetical protein [Acetobacter sp. AN02]